MATLNNVLDSIEAHIGFPRSRSSGIARRLQEAGILPSGAPGVPPVLDERDVCLLLATIMSAPMLHEAVDHARAYSAMTPGGAVLSADAPDSIPRSALEYLTVEAGMAASRDAESIEDVRNHRFEFVHGWRELSAHSPEGTVTRFVRPGELASHQQAPHRIAGLVQGGAFVELIKDIF